MGDGGTLDTEAINAAVRQCAQAGGGTVEFGPGTYLSGTIELLSNITLHLDAGATLLGSPRVSDYRAISRSSEGRATALIVAEDAHDIAITGTGAIDGNGRAFIRQPREPHPPGPFQDFGATRQGAAVWQRVGENREGPVRMLDRPGVLVLFVKCREVTVRDLKVLDAPNWCIHLACCNRALLSGLNVRCSLLVPNADAVDVAGSQNVRISDSYLEAGDDGIAVSPCADGYCRMSAENITVSNCVIVSRSAGIRLGWAARDIRNLTFSNLIIRDSNRGICIQARATETIENILFSNVVIETRLMDGLWWGLGEPIHISVMRYDPGADPDSEPKGPLGQVRNVRFVNVTASSEAPVVLYSQEPGRIRDILFRDYRETLRESALNAALGGNLDLRPTTPQRLGIVKYDLGAFTARGVDNLELRGFALEWQGVTPEFYAGGIEVEKFKNVHIEDFVGRGPRAGTPAIL
jgi:polygalacturonase